jgi:hypothetical protein
MPTASDEARLTDAQRIERWLKTCPKAAEAAEALAVHEADKRRDEAEKRRGVRTASGQPTVVEQVLENENPERVYREGGVVIAHSAKLLWPERRPSEAKRPVKIWDRRWAEWVRRDNYRPVRRWAGGVESFSREAPTTYLDEASDRIRSYGVQGSLFNATGAEWVTITEFPPGHKAVLRQAPMPRRMAQIRADQECIGEWFARAGLDEEEVCRAFRAGRPSPSNRELRHAVGLCCAELRSQGATWEGIATWLDGRVRADKISARAREAARAEFWHGCVSYALLGLVENQGTLPHV